MKNEQFFEPQFKDYLKQHVDGIIDILFIKWTNHLLIRRNGMNKKVFYDLL